MMFRFNTLLCSISLPSGLAAFGVILCLTPGPTHAGVATPVTSNLILALDGSDVTLGSGSEVVSWNNQVSSSLGDALSLGADHPLLTAANTGSGTFDVIDFSSSKNNYLQTSATSPFSERTIFTVVKRRSATGYITDGLDANTRSSLYVRSVDGNTYQYAGSQVSGTSTFLNSWNVFTATFNEAVTGDEVLRIDGVEKLRTSSGSQSATGLTIGERYSGADSGMDGQIAELLMYDTTLSGTEIQQVEDYLRLKYIEAFTLGVNESGDIDVTISSTTSDTTDDPARYFYGTASGATLATTDLLSGGLDAGDAGVRSGAVSSSGSGDGNVTLDAALNHTQGTSRTLTLRASNDVVVSANGSISSSAAALDLELIADNINSVGGTPLGQGDVDVNGAIDLNGGTLTASGVNFSNATANPADGQITAGAASMDIDDTIEIGNMQITHTLTLLNAASVQVNGALTAGQLDDSTVLATSYLSGADVDYAILNAQAGSTTLDGGTIRFDAVGTVNNFTFNTGTLRAGSGVTTTQAYGLLGNSLIVTLTTGQTLHLEGTRALIVNDIVLQGGTLIAEGLAVASNPGHSLTGYGTLQASFAGGLGTTVVADGGDLVIGDANAFDGFSTQGLLDAGSNTLDLKAKGFATISGQAAVSGGTLRVEKGIALSAGASLAGFGTVSGKVNGAGGSTIEVVGGDMTIGDAAAFDGFATSGQVLTNGHTLTVLDANKAGLGFGSLLLLGDGSADGTLIAANGLDVTQSASVQGRGLIDTPDDPFKALVNNGSITGDTSDAITLNGYAKGVGFFDNVLFTGTYAPGLSPAEVYVGSLTSTGTTVMELAGLATGQYDRIVSSGTLTLEGTLDVQLLNGFTPQAGDSFDLFDGGLALNVDALLLPTLDPGLVWDSSTLSSDGVLSVGLIPEPGTIALLTLAAPLLMRRRRSA